MSIESDEQPLSYRWNFFINVEYTYMKACRRTALIWHTAEAAEINPDR